MYSEKQYFDSFHANRSGIQTNYATNRKEKLHFFGTEEANTWALNTKSYFAARCFNECHFIWRQNLLLGIILEHSNCLNNHIREVCDEL